MRPPPPPALPGARRWPRRESGSYRLRPLEQRHILARTVAEQPDRGGGGFLDRAPRHVDDRPAIVGKQPARELQLLAHALVIDIGGLRILVQAEQIGRTSCWERVCQYV